MSQGLPRPTRSGDRHQRQASPPPPRFELLQAVYVREAHPLLGVVKGEGGTIVEVLEVPGTAYLVEFIEDDGSTKAEAVLAPEQLSAVPPPP
jgi:hypothetical protein